MENNNAYTPYSNLLLLFAKDQLLKSTYLQDGFIVACLSVRFGNTTSDNQDSIVLQRELTALLRLSSYVSEWHTGLDASLGFLMGLNAISCL